MDGEYKGFTNYPTYAVHNWLTDEREWITTLSWQEIAREAYATGKRENTCGDETCPQCGRSYARDAIHSRVEMLLFPPNQGPADYGSDSLGNDLLQWACGAVDWEQIVERLLD